MCTIHILIVGWLAAEENEVNQLRWNGNNDLLPGQTHFLNGNLLTIGLRSWVHLVEACRAGCVLQR